MDFRLPVTILALYAQWLNNILNIQYNTNGNN